MFPLRYTLRQAGRSVYTQLAKAKNKRMQPLSFFSSSGMKKHRSKNKKYR